MAAIRSREFRGKQSLIGLLGTALLFCHRSLFRHFLEQVHALLYHRRKLGAPVGIVMPQPVADTRVSNQPIQGPLTASKVCWVIAECQLPYIRALKCGKHINRIAFARD